MTPEEARIDELLSYELLGQVEEEAAALFWLDGRGGTKEWKEASDDIRQEYIERAKPIVSETELVIFTEPGFLTRAGYR